MNFYFLDIVFYGLPVLFLVLQQKRKAGKVSLKQALNDLGFQNFEFRSFLKNTLVLLAVLLAINFALGLLASLLPNNDLGKVDTAVRQLFATAPILLIYLLTLRVIGEEIFFRGFLDKYTGPVLSSALFALGHVGFGSWVEMAGAFILGLVLALSYRKNKTLYPNLAAHLLYNGILVGFLLFSR